jgi:hypothetical protein
MATSLPDDPNVPAVDPEALEAVDEGIAAADTAEKDEEQRRVEQAEEDAVKALWKEYDQARKFDKEARAQYGVDRRYAAGTANLDWAVSANLIGAFIDILVSFLYARNPDVSVKKAPRVDNSGTKQEDDFAKTMELVVSSLWKAPTTRLKDQVRNQVRSILTNGVGWLKVILVCKGTNIPEMKTQLNDTRANLRKLEALRAEVTVDENGQQVALTEDNETMSLEDLNAKTAEYNETLASVQNRLEVALRKALAVDFVASEDIQVSLDVRTLADYVNAGWIANRIYRPVSKLPEMFPLVSKADTKKIKQYFQRANKELSNLSDKTKLTGFADGSTNPDDADQYVSSDQRGSTASDNGPAFACIVELWNRETGHVHTMVDGLKKWAKQPYQPDYPTTRFFPYFGSAFYPVDGLRHPQSLTWRLMKLQDEYCSTRSSLRLTRKRAAPGVMFDAGNLTPEDVTKIQNSTYQEFTGLKPTSDRSLRDTFLEKPIAIGDMRLYDTSPITADMEKLSGVQDALQSSSSPEKTATEAEIQQSGFASRTTSDRDVLETMLSDLAHYTGELAISGLDGDDATRIAGASAYWPHGMAVDDLLTMVEIQIEAGTTGKPKSAGDKNAWGTILPLLSENIMKIHQAQLMGDLPLAQSLTELVKETMQRMGDESDVSRFIPQMPQIPPGMPGVPGVPGAGPPMPGADPMSPGGDMGGVSAPPLGDAMVPAELMAPELVPPELTQ